MTTPDHDPDDARPRPEVNLGKGPGEPEPPFDPYRFGKPDTPVPPEYAPPGYVPDRPVAAPPPGTYPPPPSGQQYGQPPYGQPPYGQPYPSPYGAPYPSSPYPQNQAGNNRKATTALVLGILALVLSVLTFLDVVLVVPALVFGLLGLGEAKKRGGRGRGFAIAGIACALVGAVVATLLTFSLVSAVDRCGGFENGSQPGFDQCLRDSYLN